MLSLKKFGPGKLTLFDNYFKLCIVLFVLPFLATFCNCWQLSVVYDKFNIFFANIGNFCPFLTTFGDFLAIFGNHR